MVNNHSNSVYNYLRDASASFTACLSNSLLRSGLLFQRRTGRMCHLVLMRAGTYAGEQVTGQGRILKPVLTAPTRLDTPISTYRIMRRQFAISYSYCQQITHSDTRPTISYILPRFEVYYFFDYER